MENIKHLPAAVLPAVAIVGRPNVGKSTLFNRLSGTRLAIVRQEPGVTRDRLYARGQWLDRNFTLIDTGGMDLLTLPETDSQDIIRQIVEQAEMALEEAQVIILTVDYTQGLVPLDLEIVARLRKRGKQVLLAVNKVDGRPDAGRMGEFYRLGLDTVFPISAEHGLGLGDLLDAVVAEFPPGEPEAEESDDLIRVAVVGRPNVGKSTLVNYILGQPRMIVSPVPGTTRDSVDTPVQYEDYRYLFIDTAGIRRRARVNEVLEKYSVIKALKSIDRCHIALVLLDAVEGITEQDERIAGYVHEAEKGCILVVNKWDLVKDERKQAEVIDRIRYRLKFMHYAPICFTTAMTGSGVTRLMNLSLKLHGQYQQRLSTGEVNRLLQDAIKRHQPPHGKGEQPLKLTYLTQVGVMPPTFMLFMNHPQELHFSYQRYLENCIRKAFNMEMTPIRIITRKK